MLSGSNLVKRCCHHHHLHLHHHHRHLQHHHHHQNHVDLVFSVSQFISPLLSFMLFPFLFSFSFLYFLFTPILKILKIFQHTNILRYALTLFNRMPKTQQNKNCLIFQMIDPLIWALALFPEATLGTGFEMKGAQEERRRRSSVDKTNIGTRLNTFKSRCAKIFSAQLISWDISIFNRLDPFIKYYFFCRPRTNWIQYWDKENNFRLDWFYETWDIWLLALIFTHNLTIADWVWYESVCKYNKKIRVA